ncbi:MAG: hypothetical protein K1X47_08985 [Cyclobacteriaceae bacterium]|nr:hypothetical protein [Cyclobacteriaceae bacterium]
MKNLIEMAAADGQFENVEYDLLKTIAKRNGISENQIREIREKPHVVEFKVPEDKKEKFYQLYDLVHMMSIDEQVHPEESKLCNLFAVRFGYSRERIPELIESIRNNIRNGQSHEQALKRLDWMLN